MKKNVTFLALICAMVLILSGCVAATDQTVIPSNNKTNLTVANDIGVRFNDNGDNTYGYFYGSGGGLNAIKITDTNASTTPKVIFTNSQSGTFYIMNTGGKGYSDNGILMLAVNGTIPSNFQLHIHASGYQWIPTSGTAPDFSIITWNSSTLDETYDQKDFIYGPQLWKPCYPPNYPIYEGQNMSNLSNTFNIMFIDLYAGILNPANSKYAGRTLNDNGMIKIEYAFQNLPTSTMAAFNAYAFSQAPGTNQLPGVEWTNAVNVQGGIVTGTSGYYVNGAAPIADFSANPLTGNAPLQVQFTDNSIGTSLTYAWDFDNNGIIDSNEQNPTHTYNDEGIYTVKLTVMNAAGSDDVVKSDYITVNQVPTASFTSDIQSGVAPLTVHFTDHSTGTTPLSYEWDFDNDGNVDSTQQNPSYTYNTPGTYTVKLTVTNIAGSNDQTDQVTVNTPDTTIPTVTANPAGGSYYAPQNVVLTASETAVIYYTTDDSTPTKSSSQYTGSINIETSKNLKFTAWDTADNQSPLYTEQYLIYKLVPYSYTVSVPYKKGWYKSWYIAWYKKWYKNGKKWTYYWTSKWKYKWKYGWLYRNEVRWGSKYVLT